MQCYQHHLVTALFLTSGCAFGMEKAPQSRWEGSQAKMGLVIYTGNTESNDASASLDIKYNNTPWKNTTKLAVSFSSESGVTTAESYRASNQLQYAFARELKSYLYTNTDFVVDKFGVYEYQGSLSAGYGRDLVKNEKWHVSLQAGPGIRFYQVSGSQSTNNDLTLETAGHAAWKINQDVTLSQDLQYTIGATYDYLESVTALSNKIINNLAMEFSCTVQYYSHVPEGSENTENTDTITRMSLVYRF